MCHVPCASGAYAAELRIAAQEDAIVAAFNGSLDKTLAAASRLSGYSTSIVRRALIAKGLWPIQKSTNDKHGAE